MKKSVLIKCVRVFLIFLIVFEMTAIFMLSAEPAGQSAQTSGGIIETIARFFNKNFDSLNEQQKTEIVARYQNVIRKCAHMAEYGALAGLITLFVFTFGKVGLVLRGVLPAVISTVYAATDEIHQYFVPGRGPGVKDVLIDGCGAVLAVAVLNFIYWICCRRKESKKNGK